MTRLNRKDFINWNNYYKNELKIRLLKSLIYKSSSDPLLKTKACFVLNKKLKKYSKTKIINRCVLTSRSKSVLSSFWLSRMRFKELASKGSMPGIKKRNH